MKPGAGSSTSANGVFYILGVSPGDILTITANLNGYTFGSKMFQAQPDGVTVGRIIGTDNVPPAIPVITHSLPNDLVNTNYPALTGTAEADSTINLYVDGSPSIGTITNGSGSWTFTAYSIVLR